jgi:FkbM family methyltransferase
MNHLLQRIIFNPNVLGAANAIARPLLRKSSIRQTLNRHYSRLSATGKIVFGSYLGRAFWNGGKDLESGDWIVNFAGKQIKVPLRPDTANLDWIYALSLLGHDREVVETYENIIAARGVPATFIDIGANFGMHSMMFAKLGARVVSFEPNPECGKYAAGMFHHNDVQPEWHGIALGSSAGSIDLRFPDGETWLGTTVDTVADQLSTVRTLRSITVPMRPLDDVLESVVGPVLVKIDVEGAEVPVLESGRRFIAASKPIILFEVNDAASKAQMSAFLETIGYRCFALPFNPDELGRPLGAYDFAAYPGTNYAAVPL